MTIDCVSFRYIDEEMGYLPAGYVTSDSDSEPDLVIDNHNPQELL